MTEHRLKTWDDEFAAVLDGRKRFEFRKEDDRVFEVGDVLVLLKWNPQRGRFSGAELRRVVSHVVRGPAYGVPVGYVVLSLEGERPTDLDSMPGGVFLTRFARNVRVARYASGLSQERVAALCGVKRGQLSNIETGRSGIPVARIARLCSAIDTTPTALFEGCE